MIEGVTVLIRIHMPDKLHYLDRALFSLCAQKMNLIHPIILTHDFSQDTLQKIDELVSILPFHEKSMVRIKNFSFKNDINSPRAYMLDWGIKNTNSRYLAFLDFDDHIYSNAYSHLINILKKNDATIAFARVLRAEVNPTPFFDYVFKKYHFYKKSGQSELNLDNFAPIHSYLIDLSTINDCDKFFDYSVPELEDYNFLLRITNRYKSCYDEINTFIGEYLFRNDGSNTGNNPFDSKKNAKKKKLLFDQAFSDLNVTRESLGLCSSEKFIFDSNKKNILIFTGKPRDNPSTYYRCVQMAKSLFYIGKNVVIFYPSMSAEWVQFIKNTEKVIIDQLFAFEFKEISDDILNFCRTNSIKLFTTIDESFYPFTNPISKKKSDSSFFKSTDYLIKKSDRIIVSSEMVLQYVKKKYKKPIYLFRPKIDKKYLNYTSPSESYPIKLIIITESSDHNSDFTLILEVLTKLLTNNPKKLFLTLIGDLTVSKYFSNLKNVSMQPFMTYPALLKKVSMHDALIVPLCKNEFNDSKPYVKFVEGGAVGTPVIVNNLMEYQKVIRHKTNGWLFNSTEELHLIIDELLVDSLSLGKISHNAYTYVANYCTVEKINNELAKAFDDIST